MSLSLTALALAALPAAAQSPVDVVYDVNTLPAIEQGSNPIVLASDGHSTYIASRDLEGRLDLRRSDGTPAGTVTIAEDVATLGVGYGSAPSSDFGGLVLPSGQVVFGLPSNSANYRLPFVTDGTAAGSQLLDDSGVTVAGRMVGFGGRAWFRAELPSLGGSEDNRVLWQTDGTPAGTGFASLYLRVAGDPVVGGSKLFFATLGGDQIFPGVFSIDGPGASAQAFYVGEEGDDLIPFAWLPAVGKLLVRRDFAQPQLGSEWLAVDLHSAERLAGAPGPSVAWPSNAWAVDSGGAVYFVGATPEGATALFVTDGTPAGTVQVPSGNPAPIEAIFDDRPLPWADGLLYVGESVADGWHIAFANGSGATVLATLASDLPPYFTSRVDFAAWNGAVLCSVDGNNVPSRPILRTDGTVAGTTTVPGTDDPGLKTILADGVSAAGVLVAYSGGEGYESWVVDDAGMALLDDYTPLWSLSSNPEAVTALGPRAFFAPEADAYDRQPWMTDGTAEGTSQLADFSPTGGTLFLGGSAVLGERTVVGDRLLFEVDDLGDLGFYSTDGTVEGTLKHVLPAGYALAKGLGLDGNRRFVVADGYAYFVVHRPGTSFPVDARLCRTRGLQAAVEDLGPEGISETKTGNHLFDAQGIGGAAIFFAGGNDQEDELWATDGTPGGAWRVADINPGVAPSTPRNGVAIGDQFFFTAYEGLYGREVWVTDGTEAGTRLVVDAEPGPGSSVGLRDAVAFDGKYVVATVPSSLPPGPMAVDPTAGAVSHLVDVGLSTAQPELAGVPLEFHLAADGLVFISDDPTATTERIWYSSDTASPAVPLAVSACPEVIFGLGDVGGGIALFGGSDGNGCEPWVLGAGGSAQPLVDLMPGQESSTPRFFARIGSAVLFVATSEVYGRELHRTTVATVGGNVVAPLAGGCASAGPAPTLDGLGRPTLGADFDVLLGGGPSFAPVVWAVDSTYRLAPIEGPCAPVLVDPTFFALGACGLNGTAVLDLAIPADPALLDLELVFQALVIDVPGPYLGIAALSDGLEIVVGP